MVAALVTLIGGHAVDPNITLRREAHLHEVRPVLRYVLVPEPVQGPGRDDPQRLLPGGGEAAGGELGAGAASTSLREQLRPPGGGAGDALPELRNDGAAGPPPLLEPAVRDGGGLDAGVPDLLGTQALICSFGWPCGQALAVAWCESKFDAGAYNAGNIGLFQVNAVHVGRVPGGDPAALFDPAVNVAVAYAIWADQGWGPWACAP